MGGSKLRELHGKPWPVWGMAEDGTADEKSKDQTTVDVKGNRIYFYSGVDRDKILDLNKKLRSTADALIGQSQCLEVDPPPIYLHINSYGGIIFHGIAGMDTILQSKVPVVTIVDGCCASAGTFLSVVGTKRLIHENAFMLIHQLHGLSWGNYRELKDDAANHDRLMDVIKSVYLKYTKVPEKELSKILSHDIWFDAETCLKYGLVDGIIKT